VDLPTIQALGDELAGTIQRHDWPAAEELVRRYLSTSDFNAHIGGNIAEDLLPHGALLDVARKMVDRAISANSLANLAALGPMNATDLKLRMDFARLYSMKALICIKSGEPVQADSAMRLARSYMRDGVNSRADDMMRAALIAFALGREAEAWEQAQDALLADSAIEYVDPAYARGLQALVEAREGRRVTLAIYLSELRSKHARAVPDMVLRRSDGTRFMLSDHRGQVLFINFFNPYCGSCRLELPAARVLTERYAESRQAEFIFILNQPESGEVATRFLEQVGLNRNLVATLDHDNAYDYIIGEPTVWIVDECGLLVARHTGYHEGDATIYDRELRAALRQTGTNE
jgi:thiol-disulfide isomerase/thioredoxin